MQRIARIRLGGIVAFALVAAAAHAPQAFAVDGVKLLGRRSTYPIVISQPGSYRLKANLLISDPNTTAISITAEDVTLDLNGFAIIGPVTCDADTHACTASGSGRGIDADLLPGVVVKNGSVRGMGDHGIRLVGGRVEKVRVSNNANSGINITGGNGTARVNDVEAFNNGGDGIQVNTALVTNCVANNNGGNGILAGTGGVVVNNVTEANGENGVLVDNAPAVVFGNAAAQNNGNGLSVLGVALANAVSGNDGVGLDNLGATIGNASAVNQQEGIQMNIGVALGNHSDGNQGVGITLTSDVGSAFNVAENNGASPAGQIDPGVELAENLCSGALTCPAP